MYLSTKGCPQSHHTTQWVTSFLLMKKKNIYFHKPAQMVLELHPEEGVRESLEAPPSSPSSVLINVDFIVPVPQRCSHKMCVGSIVAFSTRFQTSKEFLDKAVFINFWPWWLDTLTLMTFWPLTRANPEFAEPGIKYKLFKILLELTIKLKRKGKKWKYEFANEERSC